MGGFRPTEQVDTFLGASRIAHETIYEIHGELVATERGSVKADALLRESARLALHEAPETVAEAETLGGNV